jgi:hypothetical protein
MGLAERENSDNHRKDSKITKPCKPL